LTALLLDDLQLRRLLVGQAGTRQQPDAGGFAHLVLDLERELGFSRRNSRALSLPWPIFSPL